jgi:hypothetical protein
MFVAEELVIDVCVDDARRRLGELVRGGGLGCASRAAFEAGFCGVPRPGQVAGCQGASTLARVEFLEPVQHCEVMTVGLRWQSGGVGSALSAILDADITLAPAGQGGCRLALAGSYRLPLGRLGAGADKVVMHQVSSATMRALLGSLADSLASRAPA